MRSASWYENVGFFCPKGLHERLSQMLSGRGATRNLDGCIAEDEIGSSSLRELPCAVDQRLHELGGGQPMHGRDERRPMLLNLDGVPGEQRRKHCAFTGAINSRVGRLALADNLQDGRGLPKAAQVR